MPLLPLLGDPNANRSLTQWVDWAGQWPEGRTSTPTPSRKKERERDTFSPFTLANKSNIFGREAAFIESGMHDGLGLYACTCIRTCYIRARIHADTYIPTYLHIYLPTYLPTYIHTYTYIHEDIHADLHTDIHTYIRPTYPLTHLPTYPRDRP